LKQPVALQNPVLLELPPSDHREPVVFGRSGMLGMLGMLGRSGMSGTLTFGTLGGPPGTLGASGTPGTLTLGALNWKLTPAQASRHCAVVETLEYRSTQPAIAAAPSASARPRGAVARACAAAAATNRASSGAHLKVGRMLRYGSGGDRRCILFGPHREACRVRRRACGHLVLYRGGKHSQSGSYMSKITVRH
jgi:hypothetical protein